MVFNGCVKRKFGILVVCLVAIIFVSLFGIFWFLEMGKKELQEQKANERVEAVLQLVRKQAQLSVKQVCLLSSKKHDYVHIVTVSYSV